MITNEIFFDAVSDSYNSMIIIEKAGYRKVTLFESLGRSDFIIDTSKYPVILAENNLIN